MRRYFGCAILLALTAVGLQWPVIFSSGSSGDPSTLNRVIGNIPWNLVAPLTEVSQREYYEIPAPGPR